MGLTALRLSDTLDDLARAVRRMQARPLRHEPDPADGPGVLSAILGSLLETGD
jgi:hypothetical protein